MRQRLALILAVMAVVITVVLLLGVQNNRMLRLEAPVQQPNLKTVSASTIDTATVTQNPQFTGEDNKGRKWQLNGVRATQSGTVSDSVVGLDEARGWWQNLSSTTAGMLTGSADHGDYYPNDAKLSLKGNVVLQNSDTIIHAPAMKADLQTQEISGTSGVSLTHTLSNQTLQVQAQQFKVDPQTQKATLWGRVHARLQPKE
jgi:hypothetical protein